MPHWSRFAALGFTAILAAGCASSAQNAALREAPSFQAGYGDGCATASERGKSFSTRSSRDAYLFDTDDAYRAGWRQGFLECESKIPQPRDGGRILGQEDEYR